LNLNPSRTQNHLIVVDDFYRDPKAVRDYALSQDYKDGRPFYPGVRSGKAPHSAEIEGAITDLLRCPLDWDHPYNGVFQIMCELDNSHSYVHHDSTDWAGVVYLSEREAPGTVFYRHKLSGFTSFPTTTEAFRRAVELKMSQVELQHRITEDGKDLSKWEPVFQTDFKFNRLVLYPARHFHKNASSWGYHKETGRLSQVFFLRYAR